MKKNKAYFPMFVDISDMNVVVIGAGVIASRRIETLCQFTDNITVIAPQISDQVEELAKINPIKCIRRCYEEGDITGTDMVVIGTDNHKLNESIAKLCKERDIILSVTTDRTLCDFYFPGIVKRDNLVIGVNASGTNHRQVKKIRKAIEEYLDRIEAKDV